MRAPLSVDNERAPLIRRGALAGPTVKDLLEDAVVDQVVAAITRKDILVQPVATLEVTSFRAEDIGSRTTDERSDVIHFDVGYPTMKTIFYVNDVDELNGAFRYARRSHKLTPSRLWMEHRMSIAFYRSPKKLRETETPEVTASFLTKNGLAMESIQGKANTMIIVNTMGLHQRGEFLGTSERHAIFRSFRLLDSLQYMKALFLPGAKYAD